MFYELLLGSTGKEIDAGLIAWRTKGVRGNEGAKAQFHSEQLHGARGIMRLAIGVKRSLDPSLTRSEALAKVGEDFLSAAAKQADESGFNAHEKEYYVGITQEAIDSLGEELAAEA